MRSMEPRGEAVVMLCRALGAMALALALAGGAAAQAQTVEVEVMVSHISDGPGGIDARGQALHEKLKGQFRYQSLKVLQTRKLRLALDEVGSVALPNGKQVRVRPLSFDGGSALLAVDVGGSVKTDLKVRKGHLVVIGAEREGDGKLVVSLVPNW